MTAAKRAPRAPGWGPHSWHGVAQSASRASHEELTTRMAKPKSGRATMITESAGRDGYPNVLVGWLITDRFGGHATPVCERCSKACGPATDRKSAEATLRKHRLKCRPPVRGGRCGDPLELALQRSGL